MTEYDVVSHVPREISRILLILFKILSCTKRERKGCEIKKVSNYKRWTKIPNNGGVEKAQGFASNLQENERMHIGVLNRA